MKKCVSTLAFAIAALLLIVAANPAEARGPAGRGGGGERFSGGGGERFGGEASGIRQRGNNFARTQTSNGEKAAQNGINKGNVQGNGQAKAAGKASAAKANFGGKNAPFSPGWYANHPRAWQAAHPHADAWAVAGFGTAAAWLGITAAAVNDDDATVYTSDTADESDDNAEEGNNENEAADDANDQDDAQAAAEAATARDLAKRGAGQVAADAEFLSLGVFALSPQGQKDANALVNLAVDKAGVVRGTYYDLLSDHEQAVQGAVDKQTQRVAFTIGQQGTIVFDTVLPSLTSDSGSITLRFNDGATSTWSLARQQNATRAAE